MSSGVCVCPGGCVSTGYVQECTVPNLLSPRGTPHPDPEAHTHTPPVDRRNDTRL